MSADILTFPGNPGAPVQPLCVEPRRHFGLRPPSGEAMPYIRRAARAAADILTGADQTRARVDSDLHRAYAAKLEMHASMARTLAAEGRALGHVATAADLISQSDLNELHAIEIEAELPEGA